MDHIKIWESFDDRLYDKITESEYRKICRGNKDDFVYSCTVIHEAGAWINQQLRIEALLGADAIYPNRIPLGGTLFDPTPKSILPTFVRKKHNKPYRNAIKLNYPSNTTPISAREVNRNLQLFAGFKHIWVVVSSLDSPNERWLLFADGTKDQDKLIDLITNGPVEIHQITVHGMGIGGGYKVTFMDDDWVMLETVVSSRRIDDPWRFVRIKGERPRLRIEYFKCDGFKGVAQVIKPFIYTYSL
jgi:hypothetical protein